MGLGRFGWVSDWSGDQRIQPIQIIQGVLVNVISGLAFASTASALGRTVNLARACLPTPVSTKSPEIRFTKAKRWNGM
jgi:hypothetical protein